MRADQRLVALGLADSRARAQAEIAAGHVFVDGRKIRKPSETVAECATLELRGTANPWVSRGGLKLAHALDVFGIDPAGAEALDLGASTGGFTQVLLARGAAHVTALDVGHAQLHPSLHAHPRLTHIERLNVKDLTAEHLPTPQSLIVCDVSFISLKQALPAALARAAPGAVLVALIKPQFEAGRGAVAKGVVRDAAVHSEVCTDITAWLEGRGWTVTGLIQSPVAGSDGNTEFLIAAKGPQDQP